MRLFSWVSLHSPMQHKCGLFFKKIIPKTLVLPIIEGPLKGKKWIVNSSNLSYYLGNFEITQMTKILNGLKVGDIFFDIGANVGIYSLLASDIVGENGKVIAFEPLPSNINSLKKHIELNKCKNVIICEYALSDCDGTSNFEEHPDNTMGYLSNFGSLKIITHTIDTIIRKKLVPIPNFIKIDAEGAESMILTGATFFLENYSSTLIVSLHSEQQRIECIEILSRYDFSIKPLDSVTLTNATEIIAYK